MEAMDESPASRHEEPMDTLAVPAVETREVLSDGGLKTLAPGHLAPDGPGRHTELSPHHGVNPHASLHIIYLAEDFLGCFFICSTSCLSHLLVNSGIQDLLQNYVADSWCIFFFIFFSIPARCLLWHVIPSHKQQGPVAYPSR